MAQPTVVYFASTAFGKNNAGDLILGAEKWKFIHGYMNEGKVAPVLVSTLPPELLAQVVEFYGEVEPEAAEVSGIGPDDDPNAYYEQFTIPVLKDEIVSRGIEATGASRKQDFIDLLVANDAADNDGEAETDDE